MPPLAHVRSLALARLVDELRYAPREALLRHIAAAEALAADIDAALEYPTEFLVFRITGYRAVDSRAAETVPGEGVLADLSALVEHLCAQAALVPADLPAGSLDADALCARWSISRPTLSRWRRRGLIARRVRVEGRGREALAFAPAAVAAFERAHAEDLARAAAAHRFDAATQRRMVRRARRYRERLGWSRHQTAQRLAQRMHASVEGVRGVLLRHDERERARAGGRPIFPRPATRSASRRVAALLAARRGLEPAAIARDALHEPLNTRQVTRLVNEARAAVLRRLALAGPVLPAFDREDADSVILSPPAVREGLGGGLAGGMGGVGSGRAGLDLLAQLESARATRAGDADTEHARAVAYHHLRRAAARAIASLDASAAEATALDEIETRLRWAALLRVELVRPMQGVLVATLDELAGGRLDRWPAERVRAALRAGFVEIGRAVDRFVPARGGRLAGSAGLAAARAVRDMTPASAAAASTPSGRAMRVLAAGLEPVDFTRLRPGLSWCVTLRPAEAVEAAARRAAEAGSRDAGGAVSGGALLARRWGLDGRPPATLGELAALLGLPRMHAARAERTAVRAAWAEVGAGGGR